MSETSAVLREPRPQRPCLPSTATSAVCVPHALPEAPVHAIRSFVGLPCSRYWTIELACERGHVQLLKRLVASIRLQFSPLRYRSHVCS